MHIFQSEQLLCTYWENVMLTLREAVEQENVQIARILLTGNDVHEFINKTKSTDENKYTVLHVSAKNGSEEIFNLLLSAGADVNAQDAVGFTPLHTLACYNSNIRLMKMLLDSGADVNAVNNHGLTTLHFAVMKSRAAETEFLISRGAQVNARDERGLTPLHYAALDNKNDSHLEVAETLLKSGADVHARTNEGKTPSYFLFNHESAGVKEQDGQTGIYRLFLYHTLNNVDFKTIQDTEISHRLAGIFDKLEIQNNNNVRNFEEVKQKFDSIHREIFNLSSKKNKLDAVNLSTLIILLTLMIFLIILQV